MQGDWIRHPTNGVAVVFVHGVLSSAEKSWRHANGTWWPSLLAEDEAAPPVGVWAFSYRTDLFSGSYRIGDAVDALKAHMRLDGLFDCHTIVFVAHSMGGLVVRKLLVERREDFRDRGISVGLFLVASPSLGSGYANWLELVARAVGHTQADALRFSDTNAWLLDLDKEFKNLKEAGHLRLVGKELAEDVALFLRPFNRKPIVESFSALRFFGEPYKVPGSDHSSVAAPEGPRAIQHRLLLDFLRNMPPPAPRGLPVEAELRGRLEARLSACRDADVPYRTYHRLAALFAMRSGFTRHCFEIAAPLNTDRIQEWLRQAILIQAGSERGFAGAEASVAEDMAALGATAIALEDGASEVDERHLLLALLAQRSSGTMAKIADALGEVAYVAIGAAAQSLTPAKVTQDQSMLPTLRRNGDS